MPTYRHGRHEHGQNFLTHRPTIDRIVDLVADTTGPILEIGPGDGRLTAPLLALGRPVTAVEIDRRLAGDLRRRFGPTLVVHQRDFLTHRLPSHPHVLVGNLPFHQTTAVLRRILHAPAWTEAVLLTQWEVTRRRAGVGGTTMMTAQWAPWFDFALHGRVPSRAFTPAPSVDGGILTIHRRSPPELPHRSRKPFQAMVHGVFTGSGRGLAQILARATGLGSTRAARGWLASRNIDPRALPKDLGWDDWVELFLSSGSSPPARFDRASAAK